MKKNVPYVLAFFFSLSIFLYPSPFSAQEVRLQIPIPELSPTVQACSGALCTGLAQYIIAFAKWLIAAISILAILFIMFGGLWWLTAAGSTKRIQFAKKLIWDSLMGLGLALGSVLLLGMINPNLVNFTGISVGNIDKVDFSLIDYEDPPPGSMSVTTPVGPGKCGGDLVNIARKKFVSQRACVGACHCAWFVSMVLRASGCAWANNNSAQLLMDLLLKNGFTIIPNTAAQAGDISIWKEGGNRASHIAIYAGGNNCIQAGTLTHAATQSWCNVSYNKRTDANRPLSSSNACTKTYPAEQSRFFSSACHNAMCLAEFAYCGNIYMRAPGGGPATKGVGGAPAPVGSGEHQR